MSTSRIAVLVTVALAVIACRGAEAPPRGGVDPICRTADTIAPGTRLAAATDSATPRFAVKLQAPGELAFAGFVKEHDVTLIDLGTGEIATRTTTTLCGASYLPLPTEAGGFGQYCVILEPRDKKGFSTFDIDLSKDPHTRNAEAGAKACGK